MHRLSAFLTNATRPRSLDEDRARREFIFNVLGLGALSLLLVAIIDDTVHRIMSDSAMHHADSIDSLALYALFVFFAVLYVLSLRGHALIASFLLLAAIFDLAAYMGYRWGVDLSASLLFYALAIAMSGILISAQFAFVTAILAGTAIGITVHLHHIGFIHPDRSWITELWKSDDVVVATIIFLVIALVMWLSNRETERSLDRARKSEASLKQERDLLEVRVEERTRELRQAELERMTQAYRFVEFGRLASGIFHDLMNPLAGLTLNIERIANGTDSKAALDDDVQRAKRAAAHMQNLLLSMRRHLVHERSIELFSVEHAISETLQLVATYAQKQHIRCVFEPKEDVQLYGDPVAFTQVLMNLITNAIQSYAGSNEEREELREVRIELVGEEKGITLSVRDFGQGIPVDTLVHIFEPYFTTKGVEHGVGLGLSLAKRIVEKDFEGTISVESRVGEGTMFTVSLPRDTKTFH